MSTAEEKSELVVRAERLREEVLSLIQRLLYVQPKPFRNKDEILGVQTILYKYIDSLADVTIDETGVPLSCVRVAECQRILKEEVSAVIQILLYSNTLRKKKQILAVQIKLNKAIDDLETAVRSEFLMTSLGSKVVVGLFNWAFASRQ
eukprot:CFRG6148T1